ncbi:MAG TPA: 4-hydroxythreonine-4-phosphate dehydrogenase PdxA [Verrucomicrobiae bacterium]|nr:4-hydroxythreonine-4-phosphate dehydrogenase PdxA [Verrucomicrobiae bacterium]
MSRRRIGITLGDVAGIGPEIVAKALASRKLDKHFEYVVIGNARTRRRADAADWVVEGARRCLAGDLAALVTAPISKQLLRDAGYRFEGHTELLAYVARRKRFAMMLVGGPLRVALATIHVPLAKVPRLLTTRRIIEVIELSHDVCRRFGAKRPIIAVAGLNPHAGEGGLLGGEEKRIIVPAVRRATRNGIRVIGPLPADTLFHKAYQGAFDAVVAMYHDQGLAPLKMIAFDTGVNLTLGLPFVRTSPDHGTAFDIAGKGIANPASMIAAINLAARLAARK